MKKPKKPTKQKRTTTTTTITLERSIPTPTPTSRDLQRVYNALLARHSLLHSSIESRALVPREVQATRLDMIREQYDEVTMRLAEADALINTFKDDLGYELHHNPDLRELWRVVALVRRSSAYQVARDLLQ